MDRRWSFGTAVVLPLLLLAIYLFAPFPALRAFAAVLVVIRLIGFLYVTVVPRFIEVVRDETLAHANRHQPFTVSLRVANRGWLPIHVVTISDAAGGFVTAVAPRFVVGLRPGEEVRLSYDAEGHHRGFFRIGPIELSGSDPLGLFGWHRTIDAIAEVVVYPSVHQVHLEQRRGLPAGNIQLANRLFEDVTRFRSVREYQAGDDLKRVNWKVSARMGSLYSMEYQPSIYFPVLVALNLTEDDYPRGMRSDLAERAVETAASLVFFFVSIAQEVGFLTTGRAAERVPIRGGYGHAVDVLEQLARIRMTQGGPRITELLFRSGIAVPNGTRTMLVIPPPSERDAAEILAARRGGRDIEVFVVATHETRRDEAMVPGVPTHIIDAAGVGALHG